MRKVALSSIILLIVCLTASCDPGIEYNPSNWNRIRNYEFTNKYDGFDLELPAFNGLIGQTGYVLEGEILNTESHISKLYIEKAILRAEDKEYVGEPSYRNENTLHDTKQNERQHFSIYWDFKRPLYKVLKDPVELRLVVKLGDKTNEISIPLVERKQ